MPYKIWRLKNFSLPDDLLPTTATGEIHLSRDGGVTIILGFEGHAPDVVDLDGDGETTDGWTVRASQLLATRRTWDSSTNRSTIYLVPLECDLTRPGHSETREVVVFLKSVRVIGPADFTFGGSRFVLTSLPEPDDEDRRPGLISGKLHVCPPRDYDDVLDLLSLSQRCIMHSPMQEAFDAQGLARVRLVSDNAREGVGVPLIPHAGRNLKQFMEASLPHYANLATQYELPRLIHTYCISIAAEHAEVKFALASMFMEALKFFWALRVAGKSPDRDASGLVRGFIKRTSPKGRHIHYSFEELLQECCASIGYNPTFTFIRDRNAIFHSGAPGAYQVSGGDSWLAIKPELIRLYRQIDDILLTLLRYKGPIHRWDTPDAKDTFP